MIQYRFLYYDRPQMTLLYMLFLYQVKKEKVDPKQNKLDSFGFGGENGVDDDDDIQEIKTPGTAGNNLTLQYNLSNTEVATVPHTPDSVLVTDCINIKCLPKPESNRKLLAPPKLNLPPPKRDIHSYKNNLTSCPNTTAPVWSGHSESIDRGGAVKFSHSSVVRMIKFGCISSQRCVFTAATSSQRYNRDFVQTKWRSHNATIIFQSLFKFIRFHK